MKSIAQRASTAPPLEDSQDEHGCREPGDGIRHAGRHIAECGAGDAGAGVFVAQRPTDYPLGRRVRFHQNVLAAGQTPSRRISRSETRPSDADEARTLRLRAGEAVHVVENGGGLELWLGEVKFYEDVQQAIHAVIPELQMHTDGDWLRKEFILIDSKIDPRWKHAEALKKLISDRTSLDAIFMRTCIPVLLTYDSESVNEHSGVTATFNAALQAELEAIYASFAGRDLPPIRVHLFLVPLACKKVLLEVLQQKLEGLQR